MVADEKFVYGEHFKAKREMYGKFLQQSFSFNGKENEFWQSSVCKKYFLLIFLYQEEIIY